MACSIRNIWAGRIFWLVDVMTKAPTAKQIKDTRINADLTQTQAAELVHVTLRAWQYWEAGDNEMPVPFWELFLYKLGDL